MPKYVLSYFPFQALGEPIRLLLAYGKEDWEDRRITDEEWPKYKPECPFGQMPVLEVDGKKYAQSIPLTRWLGRKNGLAGKNADEDLIIDQNTEYINDILIKAALVQYEPDPVRKEQKFAEASKEAYPTMLKRLDQMIKENGGYVALGRLTWGDFFLIGILGYYKEIARIPDLEQQYPSVQKIKDEVLSIPQVKAYFDAAYPA